jgi:hypothetical protein
MFLHLTLNTLICQIGGISKHCEQWEWGILSLKLCSFSFHELSK